MSIEDRNYYNDPRVRAGERDDGLLDIDEGRMQARIELDDEDLTLVPIKFEVCPTCDGKGRHVNPSIDCGGLTMEDFHDDPEFYGDYMLGEHDVTCYGCHGKRVVAVIDRDSVDPETLRRYDAWLEDMAMFEAESRAERMMGA